MLTSNQKNALRWHLQVIFLYYASYADRNNYKLLKTQNYRRFLIDSETVIDQPSFPPFDIAFRKIHTTAITHQQFQQLIPNIAQLLFPNKKRKEAFEDYISNHLQKLYHQILYKSDFGADVLAIEGLKVQQKSLHLLESVPLRKAYVKYIQSTCMHQKNPQQTFEHVHNFLSDFEISPKLLYKAMTYLVFFYLVRTKDNQSKYELSDFKKILICIAELNWRRIDGSQTSQEEKIILIMQQMQLSVGFKKMVDKTLKQSAVMVSFFKRIKPLRLHTEEAQLNNSVERKSRVESSGKYAPKTAKYQNNNSFFGSAKKSERKEDLGTVRDLMQLGEEGIDINQLKYIFERLCTLGQVANVKTLKSIKIKKYFQSVNILLPLSHTWLDLKIADLCRSSPTGKIQFPHFLQLLIFASKELKITLESLYQYLIKNAEYEQQAGIRTTYSTKQRKQGKFVQKSALTIFYQVEKQLEKIFMQYSENKKELIFEKLIHLLYDFDIFPAFVSKSKLYRIFQQFAQSKSQLRNLVGQVFVDLQNLFEVLNAVAGQVGQNLTKEEQILFMLERMQDSHGHRTILGSQGVNLIGDLRTRYSSIYLNALKKNGQEEKVGFEELIQGNLSIVRNTQ